MAFDLGMVQVDERLLSALDALRGDVWSRVLRDSTSRVTLLLGLDPVVLDRGVGPVGHIPTPKITLGFAYPPWIFLTWLHATLARCLTFLLKA